MKDTPGGAAGTKRNAVLHPAFATTNEMPPAGQGGSRQFAPVHDAGTQAAWTILHQFRNSQ